MDESLKAALLGCETDLDGALHRFTDDVNLYVSCLTLFSSDTTMTKFESAVASESWNEAREAAHALKGVAGNMGFVPLFNAATNIVSLIAAGKTQEVGAASVELSERYQEIIDVIQHHSVPKGAEA